VIERFDQKVLKLRPGPLRQVKRSVVHA
jgi:hypothetical protein